MDITNLNPAVIGLGNKQIRYAKLVEYNKLGYSIECVKKNTLL